MAGRGPRGSYFKFEQYTVQVDSTIETALAKIERNSHRSVIVLDKGRRVVGSLSDGDIRKAMLNRRLLTTPVQDIMNLNFVWLAPGEADKAADLFQRYHIFLIPVLGPSNELLDVLTAY